jgi:hypothetical protein
MWAERAEDIVRSKIFNTGPKRQCIEKKLVPSLTMARKGWAAPKSGPDVLRRNTQARNCTTRPIQSRQRASMPVKITSSSSRRERAKGYICNNKLRKKGGRKGSRKRERRKGINALEKKMTKSGRLSTMSRNRIPNASTISARKIR